MSIPTSPNPTPTATPLDHPMNDPSSSTSLKLPVSLKMLSTLYTGKLICPPDFAFERSISLSNPTSTSISSKSKGKNPESASTSSITSTSRILPTSLFFLTDEIVRKTSSSKAGEAIIKSVVNSSVVYPNSEVKYEFSSFTDMLRARRQVNQGYQKFGLQSQAHNRAGAGMRVVLIERQKTKMKRGVNDSEKSFGIQDLGPSSSPSFKAPWPVPASNSTMNNYSDDDADGEDEQDEITTTNPTVPAATPDRSPGSPHQAPNLDDMHAKALESESLVIMAGPKCV
ncbi:hypothetical protein BYT27DRAFT_7262059 [Phlegmacium glaucopus]|nr:hypothetical protein BYT27DRAFT_7262059 [Phlegmacium glaucopus]